MPASWPNGGSDLHEPCHLGNLHTVVGPPVPNASGSGRFDVTITTNALTSGPLHDEDIHAPILVVQIIVPP